MERTVPAACAALRRRYLTDYGCWVLLMLIATMLGLASLSYGVSSRFFGTQLVDQASWRLLLRIGEAGSASALMIGPWLFVPGIRWRWPQVHNWLGRLYAISVLAAALVTVLLAWEIEATPVVRLELLALGAAWLATTGLGLAQAWRGDISSHRRWMMRSFALTAATECLRLGFVLCLLFVAVHPAIACLGWIPVLLYMEIWLREADETIACAQRDRRVPSASRALNLGVEIAVEMPDPVQATAVRIPWKHLGGLPGTACSDICDETSAAGAPHLRL
ncbi:DUF2306 domain-containing protein [Teichococcus vastitatis]|uniref:DUF2306 domain-containing protein n=1 Tax=Teichococcus vastitatis TaxID=2307076 RepID=A0ABS9W8Y9_9PROT|nr:DUF2306 domain-containing protein [Pseudoroseomonas vastitatis]MCI0755696.1 DUF2306 domain-containing protein [Pseudoroseomonas vastitatis]